jgi:hypothetical protein
MQKRTEAGALFVCSLVWEQFLQPTPALWTNTLSIRRDHFCPNQFWEKSCHHRQLEWIISHFLRCARLAAYTYIIPKWREWEQGMEKGCRSPAALSMFAQSILGCGNHIFD